MKKYLVPIIIFSLAAIVLGLGIWQLSLHIPAQLKMLEEAELMGTSAEEVAYYKSHQFVITILTYVIPAFGFAAVLFSIGMLYLKIGISKTVFGDSDTRNDFQEEGEEDSEDLFVDLESVDDDEGADDDEDDD